MHEFLIFGGIFALGALSPGPDFLIILRNSIKYSRKIALFTILGVGLGILIHLSYILLGIGLLIANSLVLFNIIKYLGAAYLIYLGYKALKTKKEIQDLGDSSKLKAPIMTNFQAIRMGFLTNALNPKVSLFLLAFFTQIVKPDTSAIVRVVYGVEMLVISLSCFTLLALFVTQKPIRKIFVGVKHYIERAFGAVLIALGIKVALTPR